MLNRRSFLSTTSAVTAAGLAPALFARGLAAPKKVGVIGTGWYGKSDLFRLLQVADVEVTSLCDVDSVMLADAAAKVSARQKSGKVPATFKDYRKMLESQQFDIVLVDTPDHWHALPAIAAMEAGADVWLQTPVGIDVVEGQAILATARRLSKVCQVGTHHRSTPHLIDAKEKIIDAGLLGDIGMVEIFCYNHLRSESNPADTVPPVNLDYNMWTGPAPMKPYNKLVHPRTWRSFTEYSNGILAEACIPMYDMVRWMLKLGWPSAISSHGGIYVQTDAKANTTDTQTATFQHPDFPVVWQHRSWGDAPDKDYLWGAIIYGSQGTLKLSTKQWDFIPTVDGEVEVRDEGNLSDEGKRGTEAQHGDVVYELDEYPEDKIEERLEKHVAPATRNHLKNFLSCIDTRQKPVSDIEEGQISTASCVLANLSLELGRTLHWDSATGKVVDDKEANSKLARPYRAPWEHPAP